MAYNNSSINKHIIKYYEYIKSLKATLKDNKTEHTNRSHLEKLFNESKENEAIRIQHESQRDKTGLVSPDFLVKLNGINIGYIEVKKINQNLKETLQSVQIEKYKQLSNNILLTNYVEFILIRNGSATLKEVLILETELDKQTIKLDYNKVMNLENIFKKFFLYSLERITNIELLATLLAIRTKTLKELVYKKLDSSLKKNKINSLVNSYEFIKTELYNNSLNINEFSDSISQTITYGLFFAKLNNTSNLLIDFDNIKKFIPSNFKLIEDIIKLLDDIANYKEFKNIKWILNELFNIINNVDIKVIFENFSFLKNRSDFKKDPYLYFYEDFLLKYDKDLKKSSGVYYTPSSIVKFIVNSLSLVLKNEFNLETGFANKEKVTVLDFALGTGAFLLETIKCILKEIDNKSKEKFYIENHILKNLFGFEILMAPYTVAKLKIIQYLKEYCNFDFNENHKLKVVLTNTIDNTIKSQQQVMHGIFNAIYEENKLANEIKNKDVLIILGNPPYSSSSKNNNKFILNLINTYKEIDNESLNEKALISLNDDYVKFIRFSEYKIETAQQGLLGIVTNNGYLDNVTFRLMRLSLLKTFDKIYILNLNGSLRKKSKFDNETDENVFDIQTGVAIAIFIKNEKENIESNKKELAKVLYKSIKNTREFKYDYLENNNINTIEFETLQSTPPYYFFTNKDFKYEIVYNKGLSLKDIFIKSNVGLMTAKDKIAVDFSRIDLLNKLIDFASLNEKAARVKYNIGKDTDNWKLLEVQKFLKETNVDIKYVQKVSYRPFDNRFIFYSKSKGVISRPLYKIMQHILEIKNNIGLIATRLLDSNSFKHVFITSFTIDIHLLLDNSYLFPLYIKGEESFNNKIKDNFKDSFKDFINTKYSKEYEPIEILAYIYSILYSNIYRTKFIEFLKIDYPKIIFVDEIETFKKLSNLGTKLINIHLLKDINIKDNDIGIHFSKDSFKENYIVSKIHYNDKSKELFYNESSGFKEVTKEVYEYVIGSYQVIKSYLKYRKNRNLDIKEIENLEKTIKAIHNTIEIQKEIDLIIFNLKEFEFM